MKNQNTEIHANVHFQALPERRLIRPSGSYRHVDFRISVESLPGRRERSPLILALVLDRSGSMNGNKLQTAKEAALALLQQLDERDRAAIVVFDHEIEILKEAGATTSSFKEDACYRLNNLAARGQTALHEGWLTGCQAIAGEAPASDLGAVARCFLLTDGLANVGLTDPEAIAATAANVRRHTGISTSTFGIGADYEESLLAPMAVAGEGQFHHLRHSQDILDTFLGELGDLREVAATQVSLEIAVDAAIEVDVVSAYWADGSNGKGRWFVKIGDLGPGTERHVVIRFGFPGGRHGSGQTVRARLHWQANGRELRSEWQEILFSYASHHECNVEQRDANVMHWVGLHHGARIRTQASQASRQGDTVKAASMVRRVSERIKEYAAGDGALMQEVTSLNDFAKRLEEAPLSAMESKEQTFRSQVFSRSQKDYRR